MTAVLPAITEEDLNRDSAYMRGVLAKRLEMIWKTVQPHIDGTIEEQGGRVDPRFIEAGIRVLDRLAKLYRLDAPARAELAQLSMVDAAALVSSQLAELEARMGRPAAG